MGTEGSSSLPVIDFSFSELRPGSPPWDLVKSQVGKAAAEFGCFQALFNKIPQDLRNAMNGAMEEMLQLPLETKRRNVSEKPYHGYLGSTSARSSIYEGLCIVEPSIYDMVENFTNVLWPEGNIKIRFAWTNGRLYSPYHRVMLSGSKTRYSAAFFSVPKEGYIIKALEELVDEDHPLLYKPFDYSDYLNRRFADDGKIKSIPALKNYFGNGI
ncbi:hypothetical protein GH714_019966 [Hevea brasiliensis]|uniref:Uncharacterized protein n=1 Tax=Hevea brasiliensis TaxID=3981 RepID=A0A6A6LI50_HEVBR|nr:hypothetical protein GH714_019966 [Hevea brasiliensis]